MKKPIIQIKSGDVNPVICITGTGQLYKFSCLRCKKEVFFLQQDYLPKYIDLQDVSNLPEEYYVIVEKYCSNSGRHFSHPNEEIGGVKVEKNLLFKCSGNIYELSKENFQLMKTIGKIRKVIGLDGYYVVAETRNGGYHDKYVVVEKLFTISENDYVSVSKLCFNCVINEVEQNAEFQQGNLRITRIEKLSQDAKNRLGNRFSYEVNRFFNHYGNFLIDMYGKEKRIAIIRNHTEIEIKAEDHEDLLLPKGDYVAYHPIPRKKIDD